MKRIPTKIQADILRAAGYSFDYKRKVWKRGLCVIPRESDAHPLLFLIHYAKANHIRNAGTYAERALHQIETNPELTFREFRKDLVRDYNNRVSGKACSENGLNARI